MELTVRDTLVPVFKPYICTVMKFREKFLKRTCSNTRAEL